MANGLLIPSSLLYTWMQHKRIITAQLAEIHSGSVIRKCHKLLLHQFHFTIWLGIETFIFLLYNYITGDTWLCSFRSPQMLNVYLAALPLRRRVHIFSKSNCGLLQFMQRSVKESVMWAAPSAQRDPQKPWKHRHESLKHFKTSNHQCFTAWHSSCC